MKLYFTLKVPVRNYLKKYILYHYRGWEKPVVTKDNFIGRKLFDLLSNAKNHGCNPNKNETWLSFVVLAEFLEHHLRTKYNARAAAPRIEEITFVVSENYGMKECGVALGRDAVQDFNDYIDTMFRKDFHDFMDDHAGRKSRQALMFKFMLKYNITDDDLMFEMLKKDYQRYLQRLELRMNKAS